MTITKVEITGIQFRLQFPIYKLQFIWSLLSNRALKILTIQGNFWAWA